MELGSTVTLIYTGKTDDGEVFGYATVENPLKFQTGMDMVIEGLEREILAMNEAGEKKTFTVSQYDAYGEYIDDMTQVIPANQIPVRNIKVGQRIWMGTDEGVPMPCTAIEVLPDEVKFDLNHPLAGKDLTYEVELLEVEPAPENFVSAQEKARHLREQNKLLGADHADGYR